MCPETQILWREFEETKSGVVRRRLVTHYLDLVRYVVTKFNLYHHARAHGLEYDDVVHFGVLGLLSALDRYNPGQGVKFETYAVPRIRGAILDELRTLDWVPRSVRDNARRAGHAVHQVSQELGREATDVEVAARLSLTVEEYHKLLAPGGMPTVRRREAPGDDQDSATVDPADEESPSPLDRLREEETRSMLRDALEALSERDRTVIALYYYEGLRFVEIGSVLDISESRVSQIHSEVLRKLRKKLMELKG